MSPTCMATGELEYKFVSPSLVLVDVIPDLGWAFVGVGERPIRESQMANRCPRIRQPESRVSETPDEMRGREMCWAMAGILPVRTNEIDTHPRFAMPPIRHLRDSFEPAGPPDIDGLAILSGEFEETCHEWTGGFGGVEVDVVGGDVISDKVGDSRSGDYCFSRRLHETDLCMAEMEAAEQSGNTVLEFSQKQCTIAS